MRDGGFVASFCSTHVLRTNAQGPSRSLYRDPDLEWALATGMSMWQAKPHLPQVTRQLEAPKDQRLLALKCRMRTLRFSNRLHLRCPISNEPKVARASCYPANRLFQENGDVGLLAPLILVSTKWIWARRSARPS
jgi:hypothetical protein